MEEAKKRDHRLLGTQHDLFMMHPLSPGSCFFMPHGARIYNQLMDVSGGHADWSAGPAELYAPRWLQRSGQPIQEASHKHLFIGLPDLWQGAERQDSAQGDLRPAGPAGPTAPAPPAHGLDCLVWGHVCTGTVGLDGRWECRCWQPEAAWFCGAGRQVGVQVLAA